MQRFALGIAAIVALILACGCSSEPPPNNGVCSPPCGSGKVCKDGSCVSQDGGSSSNTGDGGDIIIPPGQDAGHTASTVAAGEQSCAADSTKAQLLPLDMYILLDKSGSMACNTGDPYGAGNCPANAGDPPVANSKWGAVTSALNSFLQQTNPNQVSVGIQYFPLSDTGHFCSSLADGVNTACASDADCNSCGPCAKLGTNPLKGCMPTTLKETCDPAAYANPAVDFTLLPTTAITTSIGAHKPGGNTPTWAALQGAVNHAKAHASANPGHAVIAVFATDGQPTECNGVTTSGTSYVIDQATINGVAATGLSGTPKILTFVIGIQDTSGNLTALNGIAQAGGTNCDPTHGNNACLVGGAGGDVNAQFLAALNSIRGAALGCTYKIPTPASGTPDYGKVNVKYTPGGGTAFQDFIYDTSQAACASATKDAWYYDNAAAPTQIVLCGSTCTKIKADSGGEVDVALGCQTIIN